MLILITVRTTTELGHPVHGDRIAFKSEQGIVKGVYDMKYSHSQDGRDIEPNGHIEDAVRGA